MIYAVYQDDGSNMEFSPTAPQLKLFLVDSMERLHKLRHRVESIRFRRNPRICAVFSDESDLGCYPVVNTIGEWWAE